MRMNLRQTVIDFLRSHPDEPYTARQIAQWMFESQREACEEKRKRSKQNLTTDAELLQQIVAEIGANRPEIQKKEPRIRTTEERPRRYYYAAQADYDEKRSSNRRGPNGNRWLFPDLTAMEDLDREWHADIRDCVREYGDPRCRLWSFEVKLKLNRSNVREAWFQTVSNSSWANCGYLVAAEVEDADTMKELRLLAAAQGIGLIVLDTEDPTEGSEIRIPARERAEIDWDACNRLAQENADFRDFIRQVRQFHQTGDIKARDWDLPTT